MGRFFSLGGLTAKEQLDARTRKFTGNGTPFVEVPGLIKIEAVRINGQDIPLTEVRVYPVDSTGERFENVAEKMISIEYHPESGVPILLRSELSNHGMWQNGADIFVTGEFEGAGEGELASGQAETAATAVDNAAAKAAAKAAKAAANAPANA